jgi:hypothetical protein
MPARQNPTSRVSTFPFWMAHPTALERDSARRLYHVGVSQHSVTIQLMCRPNPIPARRLHRAREHQLHVVFHKCYRPGRFGGRVGVTIGGFSGSLGGLGDFGGFPAMTSFLTAVSEGRVERVPYWAVEEEASEAASPSGSASWCRPSVTLLGRGLGLLVFLVLLRLGAGHHFPFLFSLRVSLASSLSICFTILAAVLFPRSAAFFAMNRALSRSCLLDIRPICPSSVAVGAGVSPAVEGWDDRAKPAYPVSALWLVTLLLLAALVLRGILGSVLDQMLGDVSGALTRLAPILR